MCLPFPKEHFHDSREWTHAGLSCAIVQANAYKFWCGYVRIPADHPLYGKDYEEISVDVHGGLTFCRIEPCVEHADGQGFWYGFDTAHLGDEMYDPATPPDHQDFCYQMHQESREKFPDIKPEHFWTPEEVIEETNRLADQLSAQRFWRLLLTPPA